MKTEQRFERMVNFLSFIFIGWVLGIITLAYFVSPVSVHPTANKAKIELKYKLPELTIENLHAEIKAQGIYFDTIVLCQMILETGYFTSWNCTERQNLCGMKGGTKCETNTHGYAIYKDWRESVKGYKEWQRQRLDYYQFLREQHYHESEEYEVKCESIKRSFIISSMVTRKQTNTKAKRI